MGAPPPRQTPAMRPVDHPAAKAYRERGKLTLYEVQREEIAGVVSDIPRWQEVLRWWMGAQLQQAERAWNARPVSKKV